MSTKVVGRSCISTKVVSSTCKRHTSTKVVGGSFISRYKSSMLNKWISTRGIHKCELSNRILLRE